MDSMAPLTMVGHDDDDDDVAYTEAPLHPLSLQHIPAVTLNVVSRPLVVKTPSLTLTLSSPSGIGYLDASQPLISQTKDDLSVDSYTGGPFVTYPLHTMTQELVNIMLNTACRTSSKFSATLCRVSKWCRRFALPHLWTSVAVRTTVACSRLRTATLLPPFASSDIPLATTYIRRLWFSGRGAELLLANVLTKCNTLTHLATTWEAALNVFRNPQNGDFIVPSTTRFQLHVVDDNYAIPTFLQPAPFQAAITHIYFVSDCLTAVEVLHILPNVTHMAIGYPQDRPLEIDFTWFLDDMYELLVAPLEMFVFELFVWDIPGFRYPPRFIRNIRRLYDNCYCVRGVYRQESSDWIDEGNGRPSIWERAREEASKFDESNISGEPMTNSDDNTSEGSEDSESTESSDDMSESD